MERSHVPEPRPINEQINTQHHDQDNINDQTQRIIDELAQERYCRLGLPLDLAGHMINLLR